MWGGWDQRVSCIGSYKLVHIVPDLGAGAVWHSKAKFVLELKSQEPLVTEDIYANVNCR